MDVNKMLDNLLGEPQEEQIPSVQTANEIAADIIPSGKPTVKRHLTSEAAIQRFFEAGGEMKSRAAVERSTAKRKPGRPRKYPAVQPAE